MAELKVNSNEIDTLVSAVRKCNYGIQISVASIYAPESSRGIMINEYHKRLLTLRELIQSYRVLLNKDMNDFIEAKNKLIEMDADLGKVQ